MKEITTSFEQHDLVWAKIQNYPWWPGKIIEIFEQKKTLIFKISFYADPTYSYLKEDALIPFEDFQEQLNKEYSIGQQLKKAIDLANNAFLRKKISEQNQNTSSLFQTQILNINANSHSQIFQQNLEKQSQQFQQSTIHADYHIENQLKDTIIQQKTIDIHSLLIKYKLDKIPQLPTTISNQTQKMVKDQVDSISSESQSQDPNEDFIIKKIPKSKSGKVKVVKKLIIKKKKSQPLTEQQRKVKFMKRLCSLLIQKQIQSSVSRDITIQVVKKFEHFQAKNQTSSNKKMNQNEFYLKYFEFINKIGNSMTQEEKITGIFNSIQLALNQGIMNQKFEEEKTQTLFNHFQMEDVC